ADVEGAGAGGAKGLRFFGGDVLVAAGALEVGDGGHEDRLQVTEEDAGHRVQDTGDRTQEGRISWRLRRWLRVCGGRGGSGRGGISRCRRRWRRGAGRGRGRR